MNNLKLNLPSHWNQSKKKRIFLGLNWFRNCYFQGLAKAKNDFHLLVVNQLIHSIPSEAYEGGYIVRLKFNYENVCCDLDNVVLIVKYLNDSLQKMKIVKNDNVKHCVKIVLEVGSKVNRGKGECEIEVEFLD